MRAIAHTSRGFDGIFRLSGVKRDGTPDGVLKKGSIPHVPLRVPGVSRSLAPSSVKYFTEDARDTFDEVDPRNRLVSSLSASSYHSLLSLLYYFLVKIICEIIIYFIYLLQYDRSHPFDLKRNFSRDREK